MDPQSTTFTTRIGIKDEMDIVLDFDGTITINDTTTTLGKYAVSKNGGSTDWDYIVKAYNLAHENHVSEYSPRAADRTRVEEELAFLNSRHSVELGSLNRVEQARLFRNISPDDLYQFGQSAVETGVVSIRRGFRELRTRPPGRVAVVSVNWSADFVRGCCGNINGELDVFANVVDFPGGQIADPVLGPMLTAHDKFLALETLANRWGRGVGDLIYVGDAVTDLECLLACKGIVIADDASGSLLETLRRLSFEVKHVSDCKTDFQLAWARDFHEIMESGILEGLAPATDATS